MVTIDREECPCCKTRLVIDDKLQPDIATVRIGCQQEHRPSGKLISAKLSWTCLICGCTWLHGQTGIRENAT